MELTIDQHAFLRRVREIGIEQGRASRPAQLDRWSRKLLTATTIDAVIRR